jgi:hypothetical protein
VITGLGFPYIYIEYSGQNPVTVIESAKKDYLQKISDSAQITGGQIQIRQMRQLTVALNIIGFGTNPPANVALIIEKVVGNLFANKRPFVASIDDVDNSVITLAEMNSAIHAELSLAGIPGFSNVTWIYGSSLPLGEGQFPVANLSYKV